MVQPLEAAVQAFLDDAQRIDSTTVSAGRRWAQALGLPMARAAVRSGNCSHVLDVLRELGVELRATLSCMQSVAYLQQHMSSLTPTCSGCGAVAVGLRKCSACKRAQYVSAFAAMPAGFRVHDSWLDFAYCACPAVLCRARCRFATLPAQLLTCTLTHPMRSAPPSARSGTGPATKQSAGRPPGPAAAAARVAN